MPVGRWVVLVVWVSLSLLLSLAALGLAVLAPGSRAAVNVPGIVQLIEVAFAVGLLYRADWGYRWALRWYLVKTVYCGGVGVGTLIGGGWAIQHAVLFGLAAFWGGLTLFLWWNREYFD